ncbi:MAG: glutamate 5-kinase [Pseudomonadota bacterium]
MKQKKRLTPLKKRKKTWVIKIGSQLITDGGPLLIRSLIREISDLIKQEQLRVVWVTSGAIASARQRLKYQWSTLPEKQALSAIGQPMLMDLYNLALQSQGMMGAQVLLTYSDFRRKESRINLRNTIEQLLDWGIVPLLNENDAVATDEIQFGDNDQLSAMVACELKADRLIILTNVGGLYDRDPSKEGARLIPFLDQVDQKIIKKTASLGASNQGRGGMSSKLLAAKRAWSQKIPTTIVQGLQERVITRLWQGEPIGTAVGVR